MDSICAGIVSDAPQVVGLAVQIAPDLVGEVFTGAPAVIQICHENKAYVFHTRRLALRGRSLPSGLVELLQSRAISKSGCKLSEVAASLKLLQVSMPPEALLDVANDCRTSGITSKRNLSSPKDLAALFLGLDYNEEACDGPHSWDGCDEPLASGHHLEEELIESAGLVAALNYKIGSHLNEIKASLPATFSGGCPVVLQDSSKKVRVASGTVVPWPDGDLHAVAGIILVAIPFEDVNRGSYKLQRFQLDFLKQGGGADAYSTIKSLSDLAQYKKREGEELVIPWIAKRCVHRISEDSVRPPDPVSSAQASAVSLSLCSLIHVHTCSPNLAAHAFSFMFMPRLHLCRTRSLNLAAHAFSLACFLTDVCAPSAPLSRRTIKIWTRVPGPRGSNASNSTSCTRYSG